MYFGRFLPEGRAGLEISHPHNNVGCQTCHSFSSLNGPGTMQKIDTQTCQGCHSDAVAAKTPFHDGKFGADCTDCHSFHKPELVIAATDTMLLEFAVRAAVLCSDCHTTAGTMPTVSAGHQLAAKLIHSQHSLEIAEAPSQFCLSCHDAGKPSSIARVNFISAPRFHVSASHVFGQTLVPGLRKAGAAFRIQDKLPPHLVVIDGKMECQTCHSLISERESLLSQTIEEGLCGSCHQRNGEDKTSPEYTIQP